MSLTDNLIHYWKCDESTWNMSDSVWSITWTVYWVTRTTWKISNWLNIDAKSDYVLFSSTINSNPISVSLRYYCNSDWDWNCIMQDASTWRHHIMINSSRVIWFYNSSTGFVSSWYTLSLNTWYHIVMIKNGNNQKIYVNNSLKLDSNSSFSNATYPLSEIWNRWGQWPLWKIDEIWVRDREISEAEISQLYDNWRWLAYPFTWRQLTLWEYLWAWSWITKLLLHLNGDANDSSGNSNNGTGTNITYGDWPLWKCAVFNWSWYITTPNTITVSWHITFNILIKSTDLSWVKEVVSSGTNNGNDFRYFTATDSVGDWLWIQGYFVYWTYPYHSYLEWWDWKLMTIVFNVSITNKISFYINWELKRVDTWFNQSGNFNISWLYIGSNPTYTNQKFIWNMDECSIDLASRDASQVKKYYTMIKWRFGIV